MSDNPLLEESLPGIIDAIVDSYTTCRRANHLGRHPLPNRETIQEIIQDLMDVLYPGFYRRQNLHAVNVKYHVGDLIDGLHVRLTQQIARVLRHEHTGPDAGVDFEREAQQRSMEFLRRLPDIRALLDRDVQAALDGDPAARSCHEIVFCYPGLEAVTIYRLAHELLQLEVPLIPRIMTEYAHSKTGIDIHPGARIGHSFFIDHGTGVVIGETCIIGNQVKLYQGVTLGALSFPRDTQGKIIRGRKRHPTLEDDVVVYANATILGGDTVIGHHSVIGSSVWLTHSVDPYTVVSMEKPNLRMKGPGSEFTLMYEI